MNLSVLAADTATTKLSVSSAKAEPGENITINVNLKNNPGIISACINVSFDSGLTLIEAKNGDVFPASITFTQPKQLSNGNVITGNCSFAWSGTDINDNDIKDGLMLALTFSVSSEAKDGDSYSISVTARRGDIVDKNLSVINLGSANGKVAVSGEGVATDEENPETALKSFFDWLKRLISMIKALFSKAVKL